MDSNTLRLLSKLHVPEGKNYPYTLYICILMQPPLYPDQFEERTNNKHKFIEIQPLLAVHHSGFEVR